MLGTVLPLFFKIPGRAGSHRCVRNECMSVSFQFYGTLAYFALGPSGSMLSVIGTSVGFPASRPCATRAKQALDQKAASLYHIR
jgi:hypothetical protein